MKSYLINKSFKLTLTLALSLAFFATSHLPAQAKTSEEQIIERLQAVATTMNKQFPLKMDQYTHMIKLKVVDGPVLEYHYLLHDMVYKDNNLLINFDSIRQANIESFCVNKVSSEFLQNGVRLDFIYIGMNGDEIERYSISNEDCKLLDVQKKEQSAMSPEEKLATQLQKFAQSVNEQLPVKVDDYITLQELSTRDDNRLVYNYLINDTLIEEQKVPVDYDSLRPQSIKAFCANTVNRETLKLGAVFDLIYLGNSGNELLNFSIQESDCK